MEKNHATNVAATKETWAKRCDGFVAFSTAADAAIPAVNITHEGDEVGEGEAWREGWVGEGEVWVWVGEGEAQGEVRFWRLCRWPASM